MSRQDRRTKRASIGLESLEGRAVLSTLGAMTAPVKGALASRISDLDLQGSGHGSPSTVLGGPDVGTTVFLNGTGVVTGLGSVKIGGALHGTGFIAKSHVDGSLTLSNHKGSLTLQLQARSPVGSRRQRPVCTILPQRAARAPTRGTSPGAPSRWSWVPTLST